MALLAGRAGGKRHGSGIRGMKDGWVDICMSLTVQDGWPSTMLSMTMSMKSSPTERNDGIEWFSTE